MRGTRNLAFRPTPAHKDSNDEPRAGDGWRAPVPQDCWALAVPIPRMLVQPDDAPDDAFPQGVQEDRPVAHVQRA